MRIVFLLLLLLYACAPRGGEISYMVSKTVDEVRWTQNERTSVFKNLVGRGVVEFRWKDEDGEHKKQGDLDFWKQGENVSMRISKLGEPLVWLGGGQNACWLFDLMADQRTLTIGGDNFLLSDIQTSLILLGLEPLPDGEMEIDDGIVTLRDSLDRTWTATFDPTTHRPIEIQVDRGIGKSSALHRTGILVEMANQLELFWPSTGGLIDLEDSHESTKIKIAFSSLSTVVDEEPMDRVFNLSFLQGMLKPSVIMDHTQ